MGYTGFRSGRDSDASGLKVNGKDELRNCDLVAEELGFALRIASAAASTLRLGFFLQAG